MNKIQEQAEKFFAELPGKRGIDIPEEIFDKIHPIANGITQPLWGRPPTPEHLQHLYENGHHDPDSIHAMYDALPHPHAPGVKVGEYDGWKQAFTKWEAHSK